MARVGILGPGKMGTAVATNLLSKRNEVPVYNRKKDRLRGRGQGKMDFSSIALTLQKLNGIEALA